MPTTVLRKRFHVPYRRPVERRKVFRRQDDTLGVRRATPGRRLADYTLSLRAERIRREESRRPTGRWFLTILSGTMLLSGAFGFYRNYYQASHVTAQNTAVIATYQWDGYYRVDPK